MQIVVVGLSLATLAAVVLATVRRRAGDVIMRPVHRGVAQAASLALGVAVAGGAAPISFALFEPFVRPDPEPPPLPLFGAALGLLLYVHVRVLFAELAKHSYLWAVRTPAQFRRNWRMAAVGIALGSLGWSGASAVILSLTFLQETAFAFLLVPMAVAIVPLYETWLLPWLQFLRSPTLQDAGRQEIDDWLLGLATAHPVPRFHVRVSEGLKNNAFAAGGLFRNLVVVGADFARAMTATQLKAVLAHEIAHVIRRDVLRLLGTTFAGGICYMYIFVHYIAPFQSEDFGLQGFFIGAAYVGLVVPVVYGIVPGIVNRRAEYGADRLAAKLLGDPSPMIEALQRMHELRGEPLDRKSLTHPTGADRIAALQALQGTNTTR